jgi:hypothetical protein
LSPGVRKKKSTINQEEFIALDVHVDKLSMVANI